MPFTLAHPAIVLPLAKGRRFSATALLAGSIVPDFEFFLQLREVDNIGHHWYGIALFDLPLGILFCYLFHNVLKQSLIPHLPPVYRRKCFHLLRFNWNRYAKANGVKVVLSLLLGIFSHLAWDSFTHHDGLFVRLMPWLAHSVTVASAKIPLYWWVQVVSSIVGMWWVYRFVGMQPAPNKPQIDAMANPHFWHSIALSWLTILAYRVLLLPQHNSFWGLVMAAIGSLAYAWLGISIIYSLLQLKNNNDGTD